MAKAKLLSTSAFIAENADAQADINVKYDDKIGSMLLEGINGLMARVADKDDDTSVDCGGRTPSNASASTHARHAACPC